MNRLTIAAIASLALTACALSPNPDGIARLCQQVRPGDPACFQRVLAAMQMASTLGDQASGVCTVLYGPPGALFGGTPNPQHAACFRQTAAAFRAKEIDGLGDSLLLGAGAFATGYAQGLAQRPPAPVVVNTVCVPGIPPAPTICNSIAQ